MSPLRRMATVLNWSCRLLTGEIGCDFFEPLTRPAGEVEPLMYTHLQEKRLRASNRELAGPRSLSRQHSVSSLTATAIPPGSPPAGSVSVT